jgi:FkbM family methyltransferase
MRGGSSVSAVWQPAIRHAFVLVLDLLRPETFWDIGANLGYYSWFVRRHPAIQRVFMFEPDPTNYALILATIRKNSISDCQAMNMAVSDREGEAPFLMDDASGATGSLEFVSQRQNAHSLHHAYQMHETTTCRVATIDGLISEGLPAPQLIKIDVEGAEHLVLAGADSCLIEQRPTLIIETGNAEVLRRLLALDYIGYRIDNENLLFVAATGGRDLASSDHAFARCEQLA